MATKNKLTLRILQELSALQAEYPDAKCSLDHTNSFELLVATVLSAQCTDERVNLLTPALFKEYPDAHSLANSSQSHLEKLVYSAGFYRTKAKNLKLLAQRLVEFCQGEVPRDFAFLAELPGVGRKTANVVLGEIYNDNEGVVVDTHVSRLSQRLGWTRKKTPVDIELDLSKKIPKELWVQTSHLLIAHGRKTCQARTPQCDQCFLQNSCPQVAVKKK